MANGRVLVFYGGRELRVTLEQAQAYKKAKLEGEKCMTINSEQDGQAFFDLAAVMGVFIDRSQKYIPAEEGAYAE